MKPFETERSWRIKSMKRVIYKERGHMTHEQFIGKYASLGKEKQHHMLLESGRGGNYSIVGMHPLKRYESTGKGVRIIEGEREFFSDLDPLQYIEQERQAMHIESADVDLPFKGGFLGFVGYDYARRYMDIGEVASTEVHIPDVVFYLFEDYAIFNHTTNEVTWLTFKDDEHLNRWKELWLDAREYEQKMRSNKQSLEIVAGMSEDIFCEGVAHIQQLIENNRVEQVNLTVLQKAKSDIPALHMYLVLRQINPSPYMAFIQHEQFQVVSGSPELLLKKRGTQIETRPIGGTRPRGMTPEEDAAYIQDLKNARKDLEEHDMLVQLEVKDFKKVCVPNTVEVNESEEIEKYSHVMHLVSNVRGRLKDDVTLQELVEAVFPGGSITGDPKLPTMRAIERLEPTKRNLYTGSIGWIGFDGDLEWNIVIRTALVEAGTYYVQAGAGITSDSVAKEEYAESLMKAEALFEALRLTE